MPTLIDPGPSRRGWHRLELVLRCPQLYAWSHLNQGPRQESNKEPLVRGSLVHVGLAHHYARMKCEQEGTDPEEFYAPADAVRMLADLKAMKGADVAYDLEPQVQVLLDAYIRTYPFERFKVIAVEELLEGTIGGFDYTARVDLVIQDAAGRIWVWDHKTAGKLNADTTTAYSMSGQFMGIHHLARAKWGEKFAGVQLNYLGTSLPHFFKRETLQLGPHALAEFPMTVTTAERRIENYTQIGLPQSQWPKASSEQVCVTKYGVCEHIRRCQWGK